MVDKVCGHSYAYHLSPETDWMVSADGWWCLAIYILGVFFSPAARIFVTPFISVTPIPRPFFVTPLLSHTYPRRLENTMGWSVGS